MRRRLLSHCIAGLTRSVTSWIRASPFHNVFERQVGAATAYEAGHSRETPSPPHAHILAIRIDDASLAAMAERADCRPRAHEQAGRRAHLQRPLQNTHPNPNTARIERTAKPNPLTPACSTVCRSDGKAEQYHRPLQERAANLLTLRGYGLPALKPKPTLRSGRRGHQLQRLAR